MSNEFQQIQQHRANIRSNIWNSFHAEENFFEKAHNYGKEQRVVITDKNNHTRVVWKKIQGIKFSDGSPVPHYDKVLFHELSADTTTSRHLIDGKFTKERTKLHKQIYSSYVDKTTTREKPILILLAGGGGSGKGHVLSMMLGDKVSKDFVTVNNDDIKYLLPEAASFTEEDPYSAANRLHAEASYITKTLVKQLRGKKANIVFDTTCADSEKVIKTIKNFKRCGYEIHLVGVLCDREVCLQSNRNRFLHKKRYVPDFIVSKDNIDARSTMNKLITEHKNKFGSIVMYENSGQLEHKQPQMFYDNGEVINPAHMEKLTKYENFSEE